MRHVKSMGRPDPLLTRFSNANSSEYNNRRGAWADATEVISRFSVVGTGLDTYGVAMLFYQQHDLEHHYAEAHHDYLQLAVEGGWLLVVPAIALQETVEFSLQMPGNAALFAVLYGIALHRTPERKRRNRSSVCRAV